MEVAAWRLLYALLKLKKGRSLVLSASFESSYTIQCSWIERHWNIVSASRNIPYHHVISRRPVFPLPHLSRV